MHPSPNISTKITKRTIYTWTNSSSAFIHKNPWPLRRIELTWQKSKNRLLRGRRRSRRGNMEYLHCILERPRTQSHASKTKYDEKHPKTFLHIPLLNHARWQKTSMKHVHFRANCHLFTTQESCRVVDALRVAKNGTATNSFTQQYYRSQITILQFLSTITPWSITTSRPAWI